MRVLALLTDAFGTRGGLGLYNRDLLTAVCSHPRCERVVAIPRRAPHELEELPSKLVHVTSGVNGKAAYARTVAIAGLKGGYDVLLCGHINLLPVAYPVARILRIPLLLEIYGIDAWQPTSKRLVDALAKRVDACLSISHVTMRRFVAWTGLPQPKQHVIANALHPADYGVGPKSEALLERYGLAGRQVIMTVGRLVGRDRAKGFDEVLDVLPKVAERVPSIAYVIVGEGPDRQRLEQKARRMGLADRVVFSGYVAEQEKADHYRLADVYAMPSRGEGFGFVFLEAMACGIPTVASDCDGGREAVLDGKLGALVDPDSPADLERAIVDALGAGDRRVPEGLAYFHFDRFERETHALLDEIVG